MITYPSIVTAADLRALRAAVRALIATRPTKARRPSKHQLHFTKE